MKYYVVQISTGDSKIAGKAIYDYETQREAVAAFHSKLGVAMGSDLYTSALILVVDGMGSILENAYHTVEVAAEAAETEEA